MVEPMPLGDLDAGELCAAVRNGLDGPVLVVGDAEFEFVIEVSGSVEPAILGVERLASAAREYADVLRRQAGP